MDRFKCRYCDKSFSFATNRARHEKVHNSKVVVHRFKCEKCPSVFTSKHLFTSHITESHPELKGSEEVFFHTLKDFKSWKENIERGSSSYFVISTTYKTKTSNVTLYSCHRSGHFRSCSKGLRRSKLKGSNKIGGICPASMRVSVSNEKGTIHVIYFPTHMGHKQEVDRLKRCKIKQITQQLHVSVPNTRFKTKKGKSNISSRSPEAALETQQTYLDTSIPSLQEEAFAKSTDVSNIAPLPKFKKQAISALISLVEQVKTYRNDDQYRELINMVSITKSRCNALASTSRKQLVSKTTELKNEQARKLPLRKIRPKIEYRYTAIPFVLATLNPSSVTSSVPSAATSEDHDYCK